ncbi:hypothetical protein [Anabaena azotica]|uniref:Uncharacterized protein n=1 Tax=Anabaena azotica FACHB-119 TaxID=947527 RepID=A0ABR8DDI2_9NOST|nr:hypothetical protein [Anabaena azotica]MBD2505053.1 hypothetical protein [Anabaena azotica FACHB-119]
MTGQLYDSIFLAVSDGSQREWSEEEKKVILSNVELFQKLECWMTNSLSDGCWHDANYDLLITNMSF